MNAQARFTAISGICMLLGGTAGATTIFTEDFNSFTGVLNGNAGGNDGQHITNHDLAHSGTLTGWNRAGAGTVHAVDTANVWTDPSTVTANPQNWAVMIWGGNGVGANIINEITLAAPIAGSNTIGTPYRIDFLGAGGVFHAAGQVNDGTTDALRIQVLRASDSAVLHTFDQIVAQPTGVGDLGLTPYSFNYTGDGTGDTVFRITGVNDTVTRFQGTIDDLTLSIADPGAPGIASFTATPEALGDAGEAVAFDWEVGGLPLDSLVITPGDIDVLGDIDGAGIGSHLLDPGPNGTTQYTLTAIKGGDTATRMVTVTLPAPEITSFTASPSPVTPGEDVSLSWQVELPVTTLTITPGGIDVSGDTDGTGTGSIIVNPTESAIYTLTATRGTSTSTANALAIVQTPPNPDAIFTEDFNSFTGVLNGNAGQNDGQHITTHDMGHSGTLTGWNRAGAGTAHAVDTANVWTDPSTVTANPQNWAVMIWGGNGVGANIINEITLAAPIAGSNTIGTPYRIDFLGAGGVYHAASQVNDGTTDALRIQVLRASDSAVLHTFDQIVAQPTGVGDLGLTPYSFNYTGDGTGDIVFRITGVNDTVTRFQGTIDDLQLSPATSPTLALRVTGSGANLDLEWESKESFLYNLRTSTDLSSDLATWDLVEVDGVVDILGTSPVNMHSIVRPGDPVRFYRVEEFPPPPILEENFDGVPGPGLPDGWSTAAGTTAWEVGDPSAGPGPPAAVSVVNCAGTGMTTYYAGSTTYSLISPAFAAPASGATLSFQQYIDTDLAGDVGTIRILDADNADTLIEEMNPPGNIEGAAEGWTTKSFALPAAAQGMNIKIEFRFGSNGNGQEWAGFYVDNVRVETN